MKGLASAFGNMLNEYKSTVHINKRDVIAALRSAAERSSIKDSTVESEINAKSDAQDEGDRQKIFRLAAIGVKEGIAEGIIKIFRQDITNPIIRTTDNRNFKAVYRRC